ncbi:MAG: nickel pincer cofactor biosynthesis protein LarB [Polyangiaceae bacterium]
MNEDQLSQLLERVRRGDTDVGQALQELRHLPFADLGYARVDHHRALRQGLPEVVLGERKLPEHIVGIAEGLIRAGQNVLVTRVSPEAAEVVCAALPQLSYARVARVLSYEHAPVVPRDIAPIALVTAGTSDLPVAEEAAETLRMAGVPLARLTDVGVAGIHRLFDGLDVLMRAPVVVVIAGMEGALPSVVGGLVSSPVIAVPTSVGYGAALGGLTALFGMLTGCAAGVTVVNIDNGFGAAMAVVRQLRSREDRG